MRHILKPPKNQAFVRILDHMEHKEFLLFNPTGNAATEPLLNNPCTSFGKISWISMYL